MTPTSRSETMRNVGRLASGTAIAQAAPLIAIPILTRLYTPVQFGEYGLFMVLLMGLSLVVSGRYEIAVPLPESDKRAFDLLVLSLLVSVALSALLACAAAGAYFLVGPKALAVAGITSRTIIVLPLGVLFAAVMQSCSYWFTRKGAFKMVARARSLVGVSTALGGIALGAVGVSSGLIVSLVAGYVVTGSILLLALGRSTRGMTTGISAGSLRAAAREFREFPLLNSPNALLDTARESLTLMLIGALFGPTLLGLVSQTLRVLRAPMSLIGQAVAQVFFPMASRLHAEGKSIVALTRRTMRGVLAVSIPTYLVVLLAGPWLFSIVFGPQWREAGVYAQILSPWLALVLVVSSLSMLPIIRRQQPRALLVNVIETFSRLVAVLVGARVAGVTGAIVGIAIAGFAVGMGQLVWYRHLASIKPAGARSEASPETAQTPRRLRVLVVSHMYPRSETDTLGIFVREQVESLSVLADVSVVVGRYGNLSDATSEQPHITQVSLPLRRGLPSVFRVAMAVRPYYRKALRVAEETGPYDIVHAHYGVPDAVVGVRLGRALGVPTVVTLHGSDFNRQFAFPFVGRAYSRQVAQADAIIGVSEAIATGMQQTHPSARGRVLHLANGYSSAEIHPHPIRCPRYLLFVGSLTPRKHPDVLLEAFARIADHTDLDLVLVGDGPMAGPLVSRARELGIAARVRFEGFRAHTELDSYLAEAAALVLPSTSEGMPIVVNEALASGTPVVASRLPGIEQQVRSDEWGILVPPADVDCLVDALLEAVTRRWDYAQISALCGVPSWDDYARSLVHLYSGLVGGVGASHDDRLI